MSIPKNRMAYQDIYEIYEQAMQDPKGIRIPFDTYPNARHYQMRMHNARAVDRRDNAQIYEPDHPLHNQSKYDTLQVRIREGEDGTHFVYIEPRDKFTPEVELLSEIEDETNDETQASN